MESPEVPGITDLQFYAKAAGTAIFRGNQAEPPRRVALKVFDDFSYAQRDKFAAQWRVSGLLNGLPGIADVYNGGVTNDGRPFVVRAFVDGVSLAQELTGPGPTSESQRTAVINHIIRIADIVAYAHRNGVVHGALKPTNVFRGPDGLPIVTDFGVPGVTDHAADRSLDSSVDAFIAPEVLEGASSSQASDVYALGAMLYATLADESPVGASPEAIAHVSADVMQVISAAMSPSPTERPRSAALFAHALRRFVPTVAPEAIASVPAADPTATGIAAHPAGKSKATIVEPAEPAETHQKPDLPTPQTAPVVAASTPEPRKSPSPTPAKSPTPAPDPPAPKPASIRPEPPKPRPAAPKPEQPVRLEPQPAAASTAPQPKPAVTPPQHSGGYELEPPNLKRWALVGAAGIVAVLVCVSLAWNFLIDLTEAERIDRSVEVASDVEGDDEPTATATETSSTEVAVDGNGPQDDTPNVSDGTATESASTADAAPTNSDSANAASADAASTNSDSANADSAEAAEVEGEQTFAPQPTPRPRPTAVAPRPTVAPATPAVPEATLPASPQATAAPEPEPTTGSLTESDDGLIYAGPQFAAELPLGWQPISENRDVGYGYRTRFNGPDNDFLYVDMTPATHHNNQETIEESAHRIAAQVSSAGPVYKLTIGDKVTWWFEYTGNDGSARIDVFFSIGDTGYAVVGGSHDDPADAYRALIGFIDSLEQA